MWHVPNPHTFRQPTTHTSDPSTPHLNPVDSFFQKFKISNLPPASPNFFLLYPAEFFLFCTYTPPFHILHWCACSAPIYVRLQCNILKLCRLSWQYMTDLFQVQDTITMTTCGSDHTTTSQTILNSDGRVETFITYFCSHSTPCPVTSKNVAYDEHPKFIGNIMQFILKHIKQTDKNDLINTLHTKYSQVGLPIYCKRCGVQIRLLTQKNMCAKHYALENP